MSLMILPNALKAKFANVGNTIELCTEDGTVLGVFTPNAEKKKYNLDREISYEEAMRRVAESDGKGRKLTDILRDLEARG
jgi:hypothetical protein